MPPRIAVCVPNYNDGHVLREALASICRQETLPQQVIVFDDCSTDNSVEVVERFVAEFPFVTLHRYQEKSVNWLQAAFENSLHYDWDYLLGVGADDIVLPGCFCRFQQALATYPNAGLAFGNYHFTDQRHQTLSSRSSGQLSLCCLSGDALRTQLRKPDFFEMGAGSIIRRDAFQWIVRLRAYDMGPWADSVSYSAAAMRFDACYIPEFLAGFCVAKEGPSYHQRVLGEVTQSLNYFRRVFAFLHSAEVLAHVPRDVIVSLEDRAMSALRPEAATVARLARHCWHLCDQIQYGDRTSLHERSQELVREFPTMSQTLVMLALLLARTGRTKEAFEVYQKTRGLCPNPLYTVEEFGIFPALMIQFCREMANG